MISLVADIGGTNMRIAQTNGVNSIEQIKKYKVTDYASPEATLRAYMSEVGLDKVDQVCLAIACPINSDIVAMTNHDWSFSIKETKASLGLSKLFVINDFTAIALSVPFLSDEQKIKVGSGEAQAKQPIAVCGAGTGLGVAHVINVNDKWIPLPGEGGHVDFAPNNDEEAYVLKFLANELGHVSAERLLSGQGIANIYRALAAKSDMAEKALEPAQVTEKALANSCPVCKASLDMFCEAIGSFAGNLALNLNTTSGVYIAGGVVPRFIEYVLNSSFRKRFDAKGRFEALNKNIPVYIVTEEQPGLLGAAAYLAQN